jgi:hypothetical protein
MVVFFVYDRFAYNEAIIAMTALIMSLSHHHPTPRPSREGN